MVPWTLLEIDLFTCDDHTFLLVVDVTSRFPLVRILSNESTKSVIISLKGIYCNFRLPRKILSDNGPCFRSQEFIDFHAKLNVSVEKSSAYNHQSVGSIERMVQTIKQIMVKNAGNAWMAMLIYRATDIPGVNKSPSEILNGRKFRTSLPMIDVHKKIIKDELKKMSEKRANRPTFGKELPKLPVDTEVLYEQNPDLNKLKRPKWCKGMTSHRTNLRKYTILTDRDRVITRSTRHLKGYQMHSGRISKAPERLIEK